MREKGILPVILVTAFVSIYLPQLAASKESAQPLVSSSMALKADAGNEQYPLCQDIEKILILVENRAYLSSERTFNFSQLSIPNEMTDFKFVPWKASSEAEFSRKLPLEHEKLTAYLVRNSGEIEKVTKSNIDVYNRSIANEIYRISYNGYHVNYLYEPDTVRRGYKKIFNDNASGADPFIFKNEVFFAEERGKTFLILQYKSFKQGDIPVKVICKYNLK